MSRVIIVGAGASGMMAAVAAAQQGAEVILLEKMDQPGRKLRITGKGRCNLTNTAPLKDFLSHIGPDSRFMRNSFSLLFNTQLMEFFEQRNVPLVEERGHRIFPRSGKSLDIFLALINDLEARPNVQIRKNCAVKSLNEDFQPSVPTPSSSPPADSPTPPPAPPALAIVWLPKPVTRSPLRYRPSSPSPAKNLSMTTSSVLSSRTSISLSPVPMARNSSTASAN